MARPVVPFLTFIVALTLLSSIPSASAAQVDTTTPEAQQDAWVDGLGGALVTGDIEHTEISVVHGFGLGGKVTVRHTGDAITVSWSEGITTCWMSLSPNVGAATNGPTCVY